MSKKLFESKRNRLIKAMLNVIASSFSEEKNHIYEQITQDPKIHYLSLDISDEKRVSYATKPEGKYEAKQRRSTTLAKYINKFCEHDMKEAELDKFCNAVVSAIVDSSEYVKVEEGNTSKRLLQEFGGHTCMTGEANQKKIILYDDNNVGLVLYDDGKNKGRALLWTTDDGDKVMDRIYPNSGGHIDIMREWATKNNVAYRNNTGAADSEFIRVSDGKQHFVTVNHKNVFPYCDTFQWGILISKDQAVLSNQNSFDEKKFPQQYKFRLSSTDGRGPKVFFCSCCNSITDINEKTANKDNEDLCNKCFKERYFICMWCQKVQDKNVEKKEIPLFNGEAVCSDCSKEFVNCPSCNKEVPTILFEEGNESCVLCEFETELES